VIKEIPDCPEDRHQLGGWLNDAGLVGEGAEIGVLHGSFSDVIMSQWRGRLLHLIDPWVEQSEDVYRETTNKDIDWRSAFKEALGKMVPYSERVKFYKMLSSEAVTRFKDEQLDFVFIDGNHSYEAVTLDLELWWPKVKRGGLFSGHDYENIVTNGKHCEVKKAVDEFVELKNLELHTTPCSSWWITKK
jgi:hypothetical protein